MLLHGVGTSSDEWSWVLPALGRSHRVYALDMPGFGGSSEPPESDYSSAYSARFVKAFMDALGVERTAVVGNSFGGLVALHMALCEPECVSALGLSNSAGLGREVNPSLAALSLPITGEVASTWGKSPLGAAQRSVGRVPLLFGKPWRVPQKWLEDQYWLACQPHSLEATLSTLRSAVSLWGQREVLLDQLPHVQMPTLLLWGSHDRVLPYYHAREALVHLQEGSLELIPTCGHLPHVEHPERFVSSLGRFLNEHETKDMQNIAA